MIVAKTQARRSFITNSSVGIFGALAPWQFVPNLQESYEIGPHYPSTDLADLQAVVGASHANFDRVKELVGARPELAKATYDWGFGDVESALGAASHMGRKDIADFLIEHGARPNIFTFAMLGKLDAVKSMIESMPGIQRIRGPHGFTLLFHAQMRLKRENVNGPEKEEQKALVTYLESLGDANETESSLETSAEEKAKYLGTYYFQNDGLEETFVLKLNDRDQLSISRGDTFGRALLRIDEHLFAPSGAPSVRVQFEMAGDRTTKFTIHDPNPIVTATRK